MKYIMLFCGFILSLNAAHDHATTESIFEQFACYQPADATNFKFDPTIPDDIGFKLEYRDSSNTEIKCIELDIVKDPNKINPSKLYDFLIDLSKKKLTRTQRLRSRCSRLLGYHNTGVVRLDDCAEFRSHGNALEFKIKVTSDIFKRYQKYCEDRPEILLRKQLDSVLPSSVKGKGNGIFSRPPSSDPQSESGSVLGVPHNSTQDSIKPDPIEEEQIED